MDTVIPSLEVVFSVYGTATTKAAVHFEGASAFPNRSRTVEFLCFRLCTGIVAGTVWANTFIQIVFRLFDFGHILILKIELNR